ncbi:5-oxoprolinase subunit C family protein [Ferruginibacter sp.]
MSIKIIKAGVLTTLQDGGRSGWRSMGIGSGGTMDIFAMSVANYLAGNDEGNAAIEINFPAPEILFQQDAIISLTGADFLATINERALPIWRTLLVKKDSVLKFKQPVQGTKLYLAVHGGLQAENWLGSCSTHLKVGAGGYLGRALQKDDTINFNKTHFSCNENKILSWHVSQHELDKIYLPQNNIRCIKSTEWDLMNEVSKQNIISNDFIISNQSDRMGYRLNSKPLLLQQSTELISSAVDTGTVQLLPDGNCIVLMADHQTTGGYPRIASVIKTDLPKLAQIKSGQSFNFIIVSLSEAEDALLAMQQTLHEIKNASHLNIKKYL